MKTLIFFLPAFLSFTYLLGQNETTGDNSPAVIARNLSITYGVRSDAIEAILWIYEAEGYDVARRKRATEQILRDYGQSPEKQQKADGLSEATRHKLGISNAPDISNALEWDLFARSHYLSSTGMNSPAVLAKGDVNIWYGISPKALRALATQLERNKTDFANFETQLTEQAKKYEELKTELETYGSKEEIYRQAEVLLEEGKLEEAERLIESDFDASMKRQAYKGYIFGKTKELVLKYDEAAKGYKNAVNNDEGNSTYHLYYAYNENTLAHHDEAIRHYEIALGIETLKSGNEQRVATLLNNLGLAWEGKGEYDKANEYYKKALQIDLKVLGENHPNVAREYNNLGWTWASKGEYDKAIEYYKKALQIDLKVFGENHPNVAIRYNNLGLARASKGEYDKAIDYYEKALPIDLKAFGENHPNVATKYNNLGSAWKAKGQYDKAIKYFEKALQMYMKVLGENHPNVAIGYNNLGSTWDSKGEYDKAIEYFEKALPIYLKALGENHPNVAAGYNNLGSAWNSKGEYTKAIEYYEKALKILLKALGENHPNVAREYNNLGSAWDSKGEYDKAMEYQEKALQIDLKSFGESHPNVAIDYNNLGGAWDSKGKYDKAIEYYEKALPIYLKVFGENHPNVATVYNNLGSAWNSKGAYDKAIDYFEKALQIYLKVFGENHPNVAIQYNNLGEVWRAKGGYDKAIEYYEKCQAIYDRFFPPTHPDQKSVAENLSGVANSRGMELYSEKNFQQALGYFQKALKNAQRAQDGVFSLACLNNMGSMQKHLKKYEEALQSLDEGLQIAAQLNRELDQEIKKQLTPEKLNQPEVQVKIAERKNLTLIRRMQYHKVGCLKGLKKEKEANMLAKQLWQEGSEATDTRLLEDLRKEGYDFGQ